MAEPLSPELAELGARVRKRRQELGLTLQQVGAGLWRHPHLSKVERGLEWPSLELVAHLEVQLSIPTGTYVKQYGAIEKLRWGHQATYRRSGVPANPQPAALGVPIVLHSEDGSASPVTPAMIRDYDPADQPPYRVASERIHYVVDRREGWTESTMTWRIVAGVDGAPDFQFNIGYPPSARRVDVEVLGGGVLGQLGQHGPRHLHLGVDFNEALAPNAEHTVTVTVRISGLVQVPVSKYTTSSDPNGMSEVLVEFRGAPPQDVWWFEHLPSDAAPGVRSAERGLTPDGSHRVQRAFLTTRVGAAYGIGWKW